MFRILALKRQHPVWQAIVLLLSVYVLAMLAAEALFHFSYEQIRVLAVMDDLICAVFIADFFYQLYLAKNKLGYLKWGWIDLVSSVPNLPFLRIGRALRILKVLRAARSTKHLIAFAYTRRAQSALVAANLIAFIVLIFASVAILKVESVPESNIKGASDAIWWAVSTITTVGYGDRYPVTTEGRLIAVALMIAGINLFSFITAYVTTLFLEPERKKLAREDKKLESADANILNELKEIKETLKRLEAERK